MAKTKIEKNADPISMRNLLRETFFSPTSISSLLNSKRGKTKVFDTLQYNFIEFTTNELGKAALEQLHGHILAMHQSNPKTLDEEYYTHST